MPANPWLIPLILGALLLIIYVLWSIVPTLTGLPWRPTSYPRARAALKLANVRPGELVYDLGSGDGRVPVLAAREFQARAVGIELSPLHCLVSRLYARIQRVGALVEIRRADFYSVDLSEADVVFAYMTSAQVARLRPRLESQLRRGARVVTISFDMDGWEPQAVDRDQLIFLYQMPPQAGNLGTFLAKNI